MMEVTSYSDNALVEGEIAKILQEHPEIRELAEIAKAQKRKQQREARKKRATKAKEWKKKNGGVK